MFRAFHEKRESEKGFTLIELLVVILIIAILAAIAIPVFLRQREKAWVSQAESALKNAATAMESYSTGNDGDYPATTTTEAGTVSALGNEGYRSTSDVVVTIEAASAATGFCLEANHGKLTSNYKFDTRSSGAGAPVTGDC